MSNKKFILHENTGQYYVSSPSILISEKEIIKMAQILARKRLAKGQYINGVSSAISAIKVLMQEYTSEVFGVLFLNNKNRIIKFEPMFYGSISSAAVYPREVVKAAIKNNAAAVIYVHNHPSGDVEPSQADKNITDQLKKALSLIDVESLDHFIVSAERHFSFSEAGLI